MASEETLRTGIGISAGSVRESVDVRVKTEFSTGVSSAAAVLVSGDGCVGVSAGVFTVVALEGSSAWPGSPASLVVVVVAASLVLVEVTCVGLVSAGEAAVVVCVVPLVGSASLLTVSSAGLSMSPAPIHYADRAAQRYLNSVASLAGAYSAV